MENIEKEIEKIETYDDDTSKFKWEDNWKKDLLILTRIFLITEVISDYSAMIYRTSNGKVGSTAHLLQVSGPFGRTCGFSKHLAGAGNYNNNGLNTVVEKERYLD